MELSSYNELLDAVSRPNEWNLGTGLVGTSAAIREFAAELSTTRSRLEQNPNGAQCVVVFRATGYARLDGGIRTQLGLGDVTSVVLRRAAHFYNEGLLFGVGPRKGIFESSGDAAVVVQGLEYLDKRVLERLARHWQRWRDPRTLTVLLVGFDPVHESVIESNPDWGHATRLRLPPLAVRRQDIPWALHDAAGEFGGGLDDFRPEALDVLAQHDWSGDLAELAAVVRRLYAPQTATQRRSFGMNEIREVFGGGSVTSFVASEETPLHLWGRIQNLVQECDRRTVLLMETPFFLAGTLPAQAAPLSSEWPELNLARLVSWSYMTFIEAAEPNAKFIMKSAQGLRLSVYALEFARKMAIALRTFEQHRLDASSTHDKATISSACEWYEQVCGRRQPELEDVEACISRLLVDIASGLEDIVAFLKAIAGDEFRDVILRQWRDFAENRWPKHRFDALVAEVIEQLGRADLCPEVVAEKLLSPLQSTLAATANGVDKESVIRQTIERRISTDFPKEMPVDGRDILALGVQGTLVGQVLHQLRTTYLANNATREALLVQAKEIVAKMDSTS